MKKMMVLDDNKEMVSLITTVLSFDDIEVVPVDLSSDPVTQIVNFNPEIILIDVKLGEYNGIEILEQIKQLPKTETINVILTSGFDHSEECLAKGAVGFIQKPYMPNSLLELIKNIEK